MTVNMQDVSSAMAELGRLRFGEMKVQDAMHEIVRSTHAIFDVDGAGLMLADGDHHLRNVAVSDDRLAHLEELQIQHGRPCITAFEDKVLVGAEDLTEEPAGPCSAPRPWTGASGRCWPARCPTTRTRWGWWPCCRRTASLVRRGELALLAFTDLAALLIASMMQGQEQSVLAAQLQSALNSRAVIEQAKGVLIGQEGLSAHEAYERLRAQARSERRKLAAVLRMLCGMQQAR